MESFSTKGFDVIIDSKSEGKILLDSKQTLSTIRQEIQSKFPITSWMFYNSAQEVTFDQNDESERVLGDVYQDQIHIVTDKVKKQGIHNKVNIEKKKEEVQNWSKLVESIPECTEKTLLQLIILTWRSLFQQISDRYQEENDKLYTTFQNQLGREDLETDAIKDILVKYKQFKASANTEKEALELEALYSKLVVLNIPETVQLISQNDEAALQIEGADVMLLLGGTGAGKSTTIQFLSGSKMEEVKVQGLTNITATEIKNPQLLKVTTSPFAKSETLYITPVTVDTADIGLRGKGTITLCDSPGFGDSRSNEIDIANGIGIVKAVQGCKSVRLVIVLGQKGLGERLEGLLTIVNILIEMLPNIEEYFECIQYVFTKFPEDYHSEINPFIQSKYDNLNDSEKQNKTFVKFIEDLLEKTENEDELITLNPLKDVPKQIFSKLLKIKQIKNPSEQFTFSISSKSKSAIKDQMNLHQKSIINGTLRADYKLVAYKLGQMQQLYELLNYDYIHQIYQDCTKYIGKQINDEYQENKKVLTRGFSPMNQLTAEDLEYYQFTSQSAQDIQVIKSHLNEDTIDDNAYLQELQMKVAQLILDFKNTKNLSDNVLKQSLDKLKLVKQYFAQYSESYEEAKDYMMKLLEITKINFSTLVKNHQFDDSVDDIKQIQAAAAQFGDHLQSDKINSLLDELKKYLIDHLISIESNTTSIFEKAKIDKDDIQVISQSIELLEQASNSYQRANIIKHQEISDIHQKVINKTLSLFNKLNSIILEQCSKKDSKLLQNIKPLIDQLSLLQQIPPVQLKTSNEYYKTIESIIGYVQDLKRDVDHILKQILAKQGGVNIQHLAHSLQILSNAEWIDNYRPGVYEDVMSSIKDQVLEQCDELKLNAMRNSIDLSNSDKIEKVCGQMSEINDLLKLKSLFPEIEEPINETNKWFIKQIDQVFQIINSKFNLEIIKNSEMRCLDYKKAELSLKYLKALKNSNLQFLNQDQNISTASLLDRLEDFLKEYKLFVLKDMHASRTLIETSDKDLIQNAQNLVNRIKEISDIDKYQLISEGFEDKADILHEWQKLFEKDINDYTTRLRVLIQATSFSESLALLEKVKAMIELDSFTGIQKFQQVYTEFQKQLISHDAPNNYRDGQTALINYDFQKASQIFPTIEIENNILFTQYLNNLKHILNTNIESLVDTILSTLRSFFKQIEISEDKFQERLESIYANLKKYDNASKFVNGYFSEPVKTLMSESKHQFADILTKGLKGLLQILDGFIINNNYNEAGKLKIKIDTVRDTLEKYINSDVKDEIDQLQTKLDTQLDTLIKQFETNDFYYIRQNQLKEVFRKLSINEGNEFYRSTMSKLEVIITDKFEKELTDIQEGKLTKIKRNQKLKTIEQHLKYLPDKLKDNFETELTTSKESIELEEQAQQEELSNAIKVGDFDTISALYQDYKSSSIYAGKVREIKEAVFNYTITLEQRIQKSANHNDVKEMMIELKEMHDFKTVHGANFPSEISKQYENSKKILEKFIKRDTDILNTNFNDIASQYDRSPSKFERSFETKFTESSSFLDSDDSDSGMLVTQASENLVLMLNFSNEHGNILKEISPQADENIQKTTKKVGRYFNDLTKKFQEQFKEMNVNALKIVLKNFRPKQIILARFKENVKVYEKLEMLAFVQSIADSIPYAEMTRLLLSKLNTIKNELLKSNFLLDTKYMYKAQRQTYYQSYKANLKIIQQAKILSLYLESNNFDVYGSAKECESDLQSKIVDIRNKASEIIKKYKLDKEDCEEFSKNYNNLVEIVGLLELEDEGFKAQVQSLTTAVNEKIGAMVTSIKKDLGEVTIFRDGLIDMKMLSENIIEFKVIIDKHIDNLLQYYKEKNKEKGASLIAQLGILLDKDPLGKVVLLEHKIFEGYALALFNSKTQTHGIEYVIENLRGDLLDKVLLKTRYDKFIKSYQALITEYLKEEATMNIVPLIKQTITKAGKVAHKESEIKFSKTVIQEIPEIMAQVFAIWTLQNSTNYFNASGVDNQKSYLLQPHPAQVIAIFRLLGVGDKDEKILNNLVQIGTGEGKSITLGITSCILALLGVDVSCTCYSEYLSQRDYQAFQPLFEALNLLQFIKYGTFNKICEDIINSKGDIRRIIQQTIQTGNIDNVVVKGNGRPKALLIDEVDVFFSKEFYGSVFTPSTTISDPTISLLLDFIWEQRNSNITYDKIIASQQFANVCAKFQNWWNDLFKEISKDLLYDLKHFKDQKYIVKDDKIGYQDQDNVVFNVKYGYQTLFAYYEEHSNDAISEESLNLNKSMIIKCGAFSYAEIPTKFQLILGVTGTLETLSPSEKQVVENEYKILRKTYVPSVFGSNNLVFNEKADVRIEKENDFFNTINQEIDNRIQGKLEGTKRVVLVFFETKEKLVEFYSSPALDTKRDNVKLLTEEASMIEKEIIVRNSTISGQITLITKQFGRGTDFRGRDQIVLSNGGVHVITTFLSEDLSEEIQIKGRTARQGEQGSFSMVLLSTSLEKYLIKDSDIDDNKGDYYHLLKKNRNAYQINQYKGNTGYIQSIKEIHIQSQGFIVDLFDKKKANIKTKLINFNLGVPIPVIKPSKTLVLMDITASMGNLISNAKNTIQTMFQRVGDILKTNGVEDGRVMIQIAGYRNYNSREDHLFVNSSWESKADNLRDFLSRLKAELGWGEEAIEIGLQHANREHAIDPISQVILIGDAICNPPQMTLDCRGKERFGEAYWKTTRFPVPTSDDAEIAKLQAAKIPVHAFYVVDTAPVKACFQKYATATGGRFQFLDVNSEAGANILTDLVTEEILRNVGMANGKGEEFVAQYRAKFGKSYN